MPISTRNAMFLTAAAMAIPLPPLSTAHAQCEIEIIQGPQGFGTSRALEDDVLAVGRIISVDGIPDGFLHILRRIDGHWTSETVLEGLTGPGEWSAFGRPVVIEGDVLVTGDQVFPIGQQNFGAAFVYQYDGFAWNLEEVLPLPEPNPDQGSWLSRFPGSLAIDSDMFIGGAAGYNLDGLVNAGAAFVFRKDQQGWQYEAKLTAPSPAAGDHFGISVALSGNVAIVGAHTNPGPGSKTGAAFIFRYDGSEWVFEQMLKPPGDDAGQKWFGRSVGLDSSGTIAAIGAPEDGPQNGAVYVFRYDGDSWAFEQKLDAANPVGLAPWLGWTLAIDANGTVVIGGADGDSEAAWEAGAAHVFRYDGQQWNETMKILASDATAGAHFGPSAIWGDEAVITGADNAYHFTGILGIDCNSSGQSDACDIFHGDSTDSNGDGIPDECAADLNGDGKVGVADLLILLAAWGECDDCTPATPGDPPIPGGCPADLTGDCAVGVADLLILLQNWG